MWLTRAESATASEARSGSPITDISLVKKARCAAVPLTSLVTWRAGCERLPAPRGSSCCFSSSPTTSPVADTPLAAAAEQRLFLFLSPDAEYTTVAAAAPAAREAPSRLRAQRVAEKNIASQKLANFFCQQSAQGGVGALSPSLAAPQRSRRLPTGSRIEGHHRRSR